MRYFENDLMLIMPGNEGIDNETITNMFIGNFEGDWPFCR
jgi:hypothetical protein